jgi:hypothetical protein
MNDGLKKFGRKWPRPRRGNITAVYLGVLRKSTINCIQDNIFTDTHLLAQLVQGRPGIDSRSLLHSVQAGPGSHPACYSVGIPGCFPRVNRLRRETDHLPPSSAEVKNGGPIPSLPHKSWWYGA